MATDLVKDQTDNITDPNSKADRIHELTAAFQAFTQKTSRMEKAYTLLKEKFESVNLALEETNQILNDKVEELARTSDYLNSILSHMTQGILFVRLDGKVVTCNPAAERILGHARDTLLGRSFWDSFPDKFFGFSLEDMLAHKTTQDSVCISLKAEHGATKHLEITTTFVLEGTVENRGVIILIRDVTEMRRLQVLAERNDRMKELGGMAALVAHEIRNPLGGIKGYASLLVRDLEESPESQRMAQYIVDGTNALNRLVSSVLHYARPMQVQPEQHDLNSLVEDVCKLVEADSSISHQVRIERRFDSQQMIAPVDKDLLKSAILNLMVNAAQAMPEGGKIDVSLSRDGSSAVLSIADQGVGIPEENREKIFTPFFTTKEQGTGFGLSEVHRVIQMHGGSIELESEINQGSRFEIRLPITQ